jgi:Phosphotransferase enzyme family
VQQDSAARFADALARLVRTAPEPSTVSTLTPSPAWVGWDHTAETLWPDPDDREGDLNEHREERWLDEIGAAAREQLRALDRPAVVGHGDWYSQNLRWIDGRLHVVHDWDSVIAQPEAAIAGQSAAVWPGTGLPGDVATVRQSEQFLAAYERASGSPGPMRRSRRRGQPDCGPAPSIPRRPAWSGRIRPPRSPRPKPTNAASSPGCEDAHQGRLLSLVIQ